MTNQYDTIRIEDEGPLTWIVLNRPEKANALSNELLDEFSDALTRLAVSGGPVLAIRGEGRGFSAGYDLGQVAKPAAPDPVADHQRLQRNLSRYLAMWDHPKPIIAAVHGYCVAGATQMCVFTDITIVAEDAQIGEPALPLGGGYIAPLWAPLVGPKRAKELAFIADNKIDGNTAVEWGFANTALPSGELLDYVRQLAEKIARTPAEILRIKKLAVNRVMDGMGMRSAVAGAAEMDALLHLSPSVLDMRRGIARVGLGTAISEFRATGKLPAGEER